MRQAGAYSGVMYWKTGPHPLPLARIKKIMKNSGDDVKMISGEAPIVFSKACELFIEDLTKRSWMLAMQSKRRMLHKEDVASAILATDLFDFLVNLIFHESSLHLVHASSSIQSPISRSPKSVFHDILLNKTVTITGLPSSRNSWICGFNRKRSRISFI